MIWYQRDGTPIMISKMTISHIRNCISMIRRNANSENGMSSYGGGWWINTFQLELRKRNEAANET